MANAYTYSNTAVQTTLSGSISNVSLSITVGSTTGFPASFPYILALDFGGPAEELVRVDSAAGLTLTLGVRGFGGTSAQSHSLGAVVRHVYNAVDATDFRTHEAATTAIHGVSGALVGTTDSQSLSNKTLVAPAITGTVTGGATYNSVTLATPTINTPTISNGSWTGASLPSPSITGTVAGGASYTGITATNSTGTNLTVNNSAIGNVPLLVNAITGTTVMLADVQLNGVSRLNVSNVGRTTFVPANTATKGAYVNAATGFAGNLIEGALNSVSKMSVTEAGNLTYVGTLTGGSAGQLTFDASGNLTAAGNITAGAWSSFATVWTTSGTAPSVGNGTLVSRFARIGRTIHWIGSLTFGTTTSPGTGVWSFSLPTANASNSIITQGTCNYMNPGDSEYVGIMDVGSGATTAQPVVKTQTSYFFSNITNTVPFTPGSGDSLHWNITYEAAS